MPIRTSTVTKIYLAAPVVTDQDKKEKTSEILMRLRRDSTLEVYNPSELKIPNAWGMSMEEWSRCVFSFDVKAIDDADWIIILDYGRHGTAGTAWEAGYAFAKGKPALLIRMDPNTDYSLMITGGSANICTYEQFISSSDVHNLLY